MANQTNVQFELTPQLEQQIRSWPTYKAYMAHVASAITDQAKVTAPRGKTGDAQRKLRTAAAGDVAAAISDDFAWHLIEFGSIKNPAYSPFRRAVLSLGLRYEPKPYS